MTPNSISGYKKNKGEVCRQEKEFPNCNSKQTNGHTYVYVITSDCYHHQFVNCFVANGLCYYLIYVCAYVCIYQYVFMYICISGNCVYYVVEVSQKVAHALL